MKNALVHNWSLDDDMVSRDRGMNALVLVHLTFNDRTNNVMNMMNLALDHLFSLVNDHMLLGQVFAKVTLGGKLTNENIFVRRSRDMLLLNLSDRDQAVVMLLGEMFDVFDGLHVGLSAWRVSATEGE